MTFSEAWEKIKKLQGADAFAASQVYSILCDFGVFKASPKLQIIAKIALQNGLWDIVKSPSFSLIEIEKLRNKLNFYGFSDKYIQLLLSECGFHYGSNEEYHTSSNNGGDNTIPQRKDNGQSEAAKAKGNHLTSSSSISDIENYLNSVLEIDFDSFKRHDLTLQRIERVKWAAHHSDYKKFSGPIFSYEIVGEKQFEGALTLHLYDLNGFLRSIEYINDIKSSDIYSIINESKLISIRLSPKEISRIVLRVELGSFLSDWGNAFYKELGPIIRFNGFVENKIKWAILKDCQILYAPNRKTNNISFFLKLLCTKKSLSGYGIRRIHAVLFDKYGKMRQKIEVVNLFDFYRNTQMVGEVYNWFSIAGSAYKLSLHKNEKIELPDRDSSIYLKMPFEEIGKVIFIEE